LLHILLALKNGVAPSFGEDHFGASAQFATRRSPYSSKGAWRRKVRCSFCSRVSSLSASSRSFVLEQQVNSMDKQVVVQNKWGRPVFKDKQSAEKQSVESVAEVLNLDVCL